MTRRITIIQGHPDKDEHHLCHALAAAYSRGAEEAGHEVTHVTVAGTAFPWLRTKAEFENGTIPPSLKSAQEAIARADHLLIVYPLWLGAMPAVLKAFFEQVFRPGFAFTYAKAERLGAKGLKGKSARIVVTMGMPTLVYRWFFGAHSLKSLKRNILGFCGVGPIKESLFGSVESAGDDKRRAWLATMEALGSSAN